MGSVKIWNAALESVMKEIPAMLIVITEAEGSTAGKPGFKMLVDANGNMTGTVGGGIQEYNLVETAKKKLAKEDYSTFYKKFVHRENEKDASGMICSGSDSAVIVPILEKQKNEITALMELSRSGKESLLILSAKGMKVGNRRNEKQYQFDFVDETKWSYEENIEPGDTVYIIGGGHVGLALSRVLATLDFHTVVIDNRENLDTMERNIHADRKIISDYDKIDKIVNSGVHSFAVIMTFGHSADELVLTKLIDKNLKYLGMMASRAKRVKIYENLESKGVASELLEKVYSPIGIKIKSDTPEEIAISIAAEIIKVSNS